MNHSSHLKLALGAGAVFLVLAALGVPVLANLPLLGVILICPLMMFFMMRSMSQGASQGDRSDNADNATHGTHRH